MSNHQIHQEVVIGARPEQVFRALTDASQFTAMTGAPAEIDATPGGAFSCFGGMIVGRTLELVDSERVVQAWRVKLWEAGVYSVVRFTLRAEGDGTRVTLDHSSFPE